MLVYHVFSGPFDYIREGSNQDQTITRFLPASLA